MKRQKFHLVFHTLFSWIHVAECEMPKCVCVHCTCVHAQYVDARICSNWMLRSHFTNPLKRWKSYANTQTALMPSWLWLCRHSSRLVSSSSFFFLILHFHYNMKISLSSLSFTCLRLNGCRHIGADGCRFFDTYSIFSKMWKCSQKQFQTNTMHAYACKTDKRSITRLKAYKC